MKKFVFNLLVASLVEGDKNVNKKVISNFDLVFINKNESNAFEKFKDLKTDLGKTIIYLLRIFY